MGNTKAVSAAKVLFNSAYILCLVLLLQLTQEH